MNLVAYSDSEGSDSESTPAPAPKPTTSAATSKPAFQKVVDRSNPHKIKVNLPSTKAPATDDNEKDAPPTKKARTGGGAFSGFNSLLPAPKKSGAAISRGLGRGVNLKTGATPAFSREPMEESSSEIAQSADPPKTETAEPEPALQVAPKLDLPVEKEVKLVGKATVFKPLSVTRKNQKKKKTVSNVSAPDAAGIPSPAVPEAKPAPKPKISLFSISREEDAVEPIEPSGEYVPLLKEPDDDGRSGNTGSYDEYSAEATLGESTETSSFSTSHTSGAQSLDQIAADLNLSGAARRQLFGRQRGKVAQDLSAISVINFNTDAEYAANEELRAKGETVVHNPVRAIAPGKHSLQQLVNAASNQREALEESFASGKRNKKEAGNKYGW